MFIVLVAAVAILAFFLLYILGIILGAESYNEEQLIRGIVVFAVVIPAAFIVQYITWKYGNFPKDIFI